MSEPARADEMVHLHCHTDNSQLDGLGTISEYVKTAALRGHKAIAFTDHGTMRGYKDLHDESKLLDIKPIYGIEFYVVDNMHRRGLTDEEKAQATHGLDKPKHRAALREHESKLGIRDRWHLTCWARNAEGLKNLFRLSSAAFVDGFYYKPRIDFDALFKHKEGLSVASGCLSSPINRSLVSGRRRQALEYSDRIQEAFGEHYWLETMPHAIAEQRAVNSFAVELRKRYGGTNRLLSTQDAHYVLQGDAPHHDVLLCIGTASNLSNPDRFKFDGDEFFFKTRDQMIQAYKRNHGHIASQHVKESLDSTLILAEQCNAELEIDYKRALLPDPGIPDQYDGSRWGWFKDLCLKGWAWRDIPTRAHAYARSNGVSSRKAMEIYTDRLRREMKMIRKQDFIAYFLIVYDVYAFARSRDIMVGPGRGSVGGSLVAYLMGLTAVDPLEHGLLFERFIHEGRKDLPDIDMDFEDQRRGEVFEYIRNKYGADKVCQVATVGHLTGKSCLKDVSRVLQVPLAEVNEVNQAIIERPAGDERAHKCIEDSFKEFPVCKKFNKANPEVLPHAKRLEGLVKNLGIHPAGIIASPVPLTDVIPLEIRQSKGEKVVVSAGDMNAVAAAGLVKLDVLGLRTLTVIKDATRAVKRRRGIDLDMEDTTVVKLEDPKVLKAFTEHDFGGIFQFDTSSADKICAGIEFTHFADIAAINALNRPGPTRAGLDKKYIARKMNPKLVAKVDLHPKVSEIAANTLGIIVYQEHVIRIFSEVGGFSPSKADEMRRIMAKREGDETMNRERDGFVAGAMEHSEIDSRTANKIFDAIASFGRYAFNASHAVEYGMIAYWAQWLKIYYPLEFYWALLKNEPSRDKVRTLARGAKERGIELLPPHVNVSAQEFAIDDANEAIRGSLVDIKDVGTGAAESLAAGQPYKSIMDLAARVQRRKVNKTVVCALATAGALEGMLPNTKHFVENMERWWKELTRPKMNTANLRALVVEAKAAPDYDEEERTLAQATVNPLAFEGHPIDAYKPFIEKHIGVDIVQMGGEREERFFNHWDNKGIFTCGMIVLVRYNQIGDFAGNKVRPDQQAFIGKRYANVNLEEHTGKSNRYKFDWHVFPDFRELTDRGVGAPLLIFATPMLFTGTLRAHFAVDLDECRRKVRAEEELNVWERVATGKHPAAVYPWKTESIRKSRFSNDSFWKGTPGGMFCGVVTHVRLKYDKNSRPMGFFGLLAADGRFVEVMVFASTWKAVASVLASGKLARVQIKSQQDRRNPGQRAFMYEGGPIKFYSDRE